jgi:hypothetical protein
VGWLDAHEAVAKDAKNRAEMKKGRETMRPFFTLA